MFVSLIVNIDTILSSSTPSSCSTSINANSNLFNGQTKYKTDHRTSAATIIEEQTKPNTFATKYVVKYFINIVPIGFT